MHDRPFLDPSNQPKEQILQAALGSTYTCYLELISLADSYSQAWTFTKTSGWLLKIFDRKKALLYLTPLNDGFKVSLTLRENEREIFLRDDELGSMREKLSSSKKYSEGFALQFDVADKNGFQQLELFVGKLIIIRA